MQFPEVYNIKDSKIKDEGYLFFLKYPAFSMHLKSVFPPFLTIKM